MWAYFLLVFVAAIQGVAALSQLRASQSPDNGLTNGVPIPGAGTLEAQKAAEEAAAKKATSSSEYGSTVRATQESEVTEHFKDGRRPHIVLVLADDMGYGGVGYNNAELQTPAIDKLAREGVILDNFYAASICAPSRFSLMTGREPWRSEGFGSINLDPQFPVGTSPAYTMLPAVLRAVGYKTHLVGKWHQGFHRAEYMPTARGFDTFYGILEGCSDHFTQYSMSYGRCPGKKIIDMSEDDEPLFEGIDYENSTRMGDWRYRERAVDIIHAHAKKHRLYITRGRHAPLFLVVSSQMPHTPFQVTDTYKNRYNFSHDDKNLYYGMISHLDDTVLSITEALYETQMYADSLILFMSDNGAAVEAPDKANYPFQGHKGQILEGGTHVPAFINGGFLPQTARGLKRLGLVSISDWYATLAWLGGVESDKLSEGPTPMDSVNMWHYITNEPLTSPRERVVQMHPGVAWLGGIGGEDDCTGRMGSYAMTEGKWKLTFIAHAAENLMRTRGVETDECLNKYCLFDLEKDRIEEKNVADSNQDVVDELKQKMEDYVDQATRSEWFGRTFVDTSNTDACAAFQEIEGSYGFIKPWATTDVEQTFLQGSHICPTLPV